MRWPFTAWLLIFSSLIIAACGLKASPLPRETIVPAPVRELSVVVSPEGVRLTFALPSKSLDGTPLKVLGGYRVLRQADGDEKWEVREEICLSASQQRLKLGKKEVFLDAFPSEPGTYRYCIQPFDAYKSSSAVGQEVELVWEGKASEGAESSPQEPIPISPLEEEEG